MSVAPAAKPLAHPASPLTARNVVTVASGKGGVGKTWFSVTLAGAAARLGHKVLLFDGDLGLANVDVQLGLMPERDLGGVIAGRFHLRDAITHFESGGFEILAGRSGSGALSGLKTARLEALRDGLSQLAASYDWVIADLGAGIDAPVRTLAAPSGTVLVVTTDEPTSLTDAYAFVKVMAARHPGIDLRIVVNMAANENDGRRTYEALARACHGFLAITPPFAGMIERDDKVKDAIRHQAPLLRRHPGSAAAAQVEAIAAALFEEP